MSKRREILAALKIAWQQVGGATYQVRRGPVDWAAWKFDTHPFGVSIVVPEGPLDLPAQLISGHGHPIPRELTVAMTVFWRMPGSPDELDDGSYDQIAYHIAHAIALVFKTNSANGQSLVDGLGPDTSNVDAFDAQLRVQGVLAVITFRYTE